MQRDPDAKELGFLFALAQIGLEMVAPLVVGVLIDYAWNCGPWATLIGFALGFIGGFLHLLVLLNRRERSEHSRQQGNERQ